MGSGSSEPANPKRPSAAVIDSAGAAFQIVIGAAIGFHISNPAIAGPSQSASGSSGLWGGILLFTMFLVLVAVSLVQFALSMHNKDAAIYLSGAIIAYLLYCMALLVVFKDTKPKDIAFGDGAVLVCAIMGMWLLILAVVTWTQWIKSRQ